MSKKGSHYKVEYNEHRAADAILTLVTGGLSQLLPSSVDCKMTDTKSEESNTGTGHNKREAKSDAHSKFWK